MHESVHFQIICYSAIVTVIFKPVSRRKNWHLRSCRVVSKHFRKDNRENWAFLLRLGKIAPLGEANFRIHGNAHFVLCVVSSLSEIRIKYSKYFISYISFKLDVYLSVRVPLIDFCDAISSWLNRQERVQTCKRKITFVRLLCRRVKHRLYLLFPFAQVTVGFELRCIILYLWNRYQNISL